MSKDRNSLRNDGQEEGNITPTIRRSFSRIKKGLIFLVVCVLLYFYILLERDESMPVINMDFYRSVQVDDGTLRVLTFLNVLCFLGFPFRVLTKVLTRFVLLVSLRDTIIRFMYGEPVFEYPVVRFNDSHMDYISLLRNEQFMFNKDSKNTGYHVLSVISTEITADSSSSSSGDELTNNRTKFKQTFSKAGRNVASRIATSKAASLFFDETYNSLISSVRKSIAHHTNDKKFARRIIDHCLKVIVKVAILEQNGELNNSELESIDLFKIKLHSAIQTMVTFFDVEFNFDRSSLKHILADMQKAGHKCMGRKLSQKSHDNLDEAFNYLTMSNYIDRLFSRDDSLYVYAREIVPILRTLLARRMI